MKFNLFRIDLSLRELRQPDQYHRDGCIVTSPRLKSEFPNLFFSFTKAPSIFYVPDGWAVKLKWENRRLFQWARSLYNCRGWWRERCVLQDFHRPFSQWYVRLQSVSWLFCFLHTVIHLVNDVREGEAKWIRNFTNGSYVRKRRNVLQVK